MRSSFIHEPQAQRKSGYASPFQPIVKEEQPEGEAARQLVEQQAKVLAMQQSLLQRQAEFEKWQRYREAEATKGLTRLAFVYRGTIQAGLNTESQVVNLYIVAKDLTEQKKLSPFKYKEILDAKAHSAHSFCYDTITDVFRKENYLNNPLVCKFNSEEHKDAKEEVEEDAEEDVKEIEDADEAEEAEEVRAERWFTPFETISRLEEKFKKEKEKAKQKRPQVTFEQEPQAPPPPLSESSEVSGVAAAAAAAADSSEDASLVADLARAQMGEWDPKQPRPYFFLSGRGYDLAGDRESARALKLIQDAEMKKLVDSKYGGDGDGSERFVVDTRTWKFPVELVLKNFTESTKTRMTEERDEKGAFAKFSKRHGFQIDSFTKSSGKFPPRFWLPNIDDIPKEYRDHYSKMSTSAKEEELMQLGVEGTDDAMLRVVAIARSFSFLKRDRNVDPNRKQRYIFPYAPQVVYEATPLHMICSNSNFGFGVDQARMLQTFMCAPWPDKYVDLTVKDTFGMTPLMTMLAECGHAHYLAKKTEIGLEFVHRRWFIIHDMLKLLLQPTQACTSEALVSKIKYSKFDIPKPQTVDVRNRTATLIATENNCTHCLWILHHFGHELDCVTAESEFGRNPLHYAFEFNNADLIEALLQHRCKLNATTRRGENIMHIFASQDYDEKVANLLIEAVNASYNEQDKTDYDEDFKRLSPEKTKRYMINQANENGVTPLMAAVVANNLHAVRLFLGELDSSGKTLSIRADPLLTNNFGGTAKTVLESLPEPAASVREDRVEMLRLLTEHTEKVTSDRRIAQLTASAQEEIHDKEFKAFPELKPFLSEIYSSWLPILKLLFTGQEQTRRNGVNLLSLVLTPILFKSSDSLEFMEMKQEFQRLTKHGELLNKFSEFFKKVPEKDRNGILETLKRYVRSKMETAIESSPFQRI